MCINIYTCTYSAQMRELSGQGCAHEDYQPSFLWRQVPQTTASSPSPLSARSPIALSGRAKVAAADAAVLEQRKKDVQGVDIEPPKPINIFDCAPAPVPPKWQRSLYVITEIIGAAAALSATSAWRARTAAKCATPHLSGVPVPPADGGPGLQPEEEGPDSRDKEVEEREQRLRARDEDKRSVLGVHYLDENGSPKLLFPLSGVEAVEKIVPPPMSVMGQPPVDEDADSSLQHLCHPMPAHVTLLVSVCYDDVSLPLFYASRQAASESRLQSSATMDKLETLSRTGTPVTGIYMLAPS